MKTALETARRMALIAIVSAFFAAGFAPAALAQIPPALLKRAQAGNASAQFELSDIYYEGTGVPQDYEKAFEWMEKAALQGDADAQNNLGHLYAHGEGVSQNSKKAFEWYMKAARQGEPHAQTSLGGLYEYGDGVPKDEKKAVEWYRKAAEQGFGRGQANLGSMYEYGSGLPRDYKKAFDLYTQAAENTDDDDYHHGNPYAQYRLGVMYEEGKGVAKNDAKAFEWYMKAAEQGDPDAQCSVGLMYDKGRGVPRNPEKAFEWYTKSAGQGNAKARNNLGLMYDEGGSLPRDGKKALLWYTKAANQNLDDAQYNLGLMYFNGRGVPGNTVAGCAWIQISGKTPVSLTVRVTCGLFATSVQKKKDEILRQIEFYQKAEAGDAKSQYNLGVILAREKEASRDIEESIKWYMKAANQGFALAQNNLGRLYLDGVDVPQDDKKAFEWFGKAANHGEARAQASLGFMYATGRGVPKNVEKSFELYTKAADQGIGEAQYSLGLMYAQGLGVPQDDKKAFELYAKAAYQKILSAQLNLGAMYFNGEGMPEDTITGCAWIYLSKDSGGMAQCDASLTQTQKANALKLKDELAQKINAQAAPPTMPGDAAVSESQIDEYQRRLDAMKKKQEQLLAQARRQLAAMPQYTPAELARDPQARAQEERRQQLVKTLAEIEQRIQEQNARPRKVYLSPATLGATYAPYYLAMCRKIEARGAEHFPQENGRKLYGGLMIALLVHHDGRLLETRVLQSSGNPTLDRLAEDIARSSAPFAPFTAQMRKEADQIDITTHFSFVHETARHASTSCGGNAVLAFGADSKN